MWEWGLSGASDDVALIVSELITNAIEASAALDGGPWPVRLWLTSNRRDVLILVGDASPKPPVRVEPLADSGSGRGLMLVDAVSREWGWYDSADASGKIVWAVCAMP
jgi:anti-sigma regulatory factor (Ser/Thr protein kinase)